MSIPDSSLGRASSGAPGLTAKFKVRALVGEIDGLSRKRAPVLVNGHAAPRACRVFLGFGAFWLVMAIIVRAKNAKKPVEEMDEAAT